MLHSHTSQSHLFCIGCMASCEPYSQSLFIELAAAATFHVVEQRTTYWSHF